METTLVTMIHGALGIGLIAVIGWAVNLEARMRLEESKPDVLKELFNAKFDALDQRLERIEKFLNGWGSHGRQY